MSRVANSGFLEKKAYNKIKEMIINGELQPNQVIVQDQIAKIVGASRTPLRRAFTELEHDYLLETTPQGLTVRDFNGDFLISVWEVRAVMEGLACRLSARRIDLITVAFLRSKFSQAFEKWEETNDLEAYRQADVKFHTQLVHVAGNELLSKNISNTHVLTIAFSKGILRSPLETYKEHMDILDALQERDEAEAERLMMEHIRNTIPDIQRSIL
jgi:GntR family transcriptional regulator of vanillate catabolism